jgi:hypothetical protein
MKISLRRKISLYFSYRNLVIKNKKDFQTKFNLRLDRVNRIYTVVNIPQEIFDEPYTMRTSDINKISEPYITEYIRQISNSLNESGLTELYRLYNIEKVDKFSYLIIIGYSLFDTGEVAKNIFFRILPITAVLAISAILFFKNYNF